MDWNAFALRLDAAVLAAADTVLADLGGERLYALCLLTDDDGGSVGLWANTEEGLARMRAKEDYADLPPEEFAPFRWHPEEWSDEPCRGSDLDRVSHELFDAMMSEDGDPHHTEHALEAMTGALAGLRAGRPEAMDGVTLFVSISDSDEAEAVERTSAARLNPHPLPPAFLAS